MAAAAQGADQKREAVGIRKKWLTNHKEATPLHQSI